MPQLGTRAQLVQDCEKLEPSQELQLVLLPFAETSSEQAGLFRMLRILMSSQA